MLAGVLLTLFFDWNGSQMFEELEVKQSIMIHCVKVIHPPTSISIIGVCTLTIVHFVFSIMARLIVEMLFMLFSVYNTAENE